MNPHALNTFVTIARCGSFSGAARQLGYAQSAVSQQIAALESDLGVVLLERRPVALTPAGRRLLAHADPLLLRLEAARSDVTSLSLRPVALVTLGVSPLAMDRRLADCLARLRHNWPGLEATVRAIDAWSIPAEVAKGHVDLGIADGVVTATGRLPLPDVGPLEVTGVDEQQLAVILPAGHPLAQRTGLDLRELEDDSWIDAPGSAIPLAQIRALGGGTDGFRTTTRYEGWDTRGLVALASAGNGLALVPRGVVDAVTNVTAIPITAPPLRYRVELVHRLDPQGPVQDLVADLTAGMIGHRG